MIDVAKVAAEVREELHMRSLTQVKGRAERWTLTPERQSDVYIEVGTVYGEVRLRVYAGGTLLGTFDILREGQVGQRVREAYQCAQEARSTQAAYRAGD